MPSSILLRSFVTTGGSLCSLSLYYAAAVELCWACVCGVGPLPMPDARGWKGGLLMREEDALLFKMTLCMLLLLFLLHLPFSLSLCSPLSLTLHNLLLRFWQLWASCFG